MAQLNPEQLFKPVEEVFPERKVQKDEPKTETQAKPKPQVINPEQLFKPVESKKRYIIYLTKEYLTEDNDDVTYLTETVRISKYCTRQEILLVTMNYLIDRYYDITDEAEVTGETLFELLCSSDVYCMNEETNQFAKTDLLGFFMLFKDTNLIDEELNSTFHEYINLVTEYSNNIMDEDYDVEECRDVLNP